MNREAAAQGAAASPRSRTVLARSPGVARYFFVNSGSHLLLLLVGGELVVLHLVGEEQLRGSQAGRAPSSRSRMDIRADFPHCFIFAAG